MPRNLRPLTVYPITTRTLDVLSVVDVTAGMRRVTLGGAQLKAHIADNGYSVAAFRSAGFDDECKLMFPHADATIALGPTQADGQLHWPRGDDRLTFRTYTIRRWDADAGEVDIDFVMHGDGPAANWARNAVPGDCLQIAGPKMSAGHPEGADWLLIAGDETAIPAIARWLEQWPLGQRAQVFLEISDERHRQPLVQPEGVTVQWLCRGAQEAGASSVLFDAIRSAPWWPGTPFAWIAGEALTLTPIRRWLRQERGLNKEQVEVTGYWRKQVQTSGAADDAAGESVGDVNESLHAMADIVQPFALRVAVSVGLVEAFASASQSFDHLVQATGAPAAALSKLVRYLVSIGIVDARSDGRLELSLLGRGLENEHLSEHLDLDAPVAQRELAGMMALLDAMRGSDDVSSGQELQSRIGADRDMVAELCEHEADDAVYVAGAVAEALAVPSGASVIVAGVAPGVFAEAMVRQHDTASVRVLAASVETDVLRQLHTRHDRITFASGTMDASLARTADVVVLSDILRSRADGEAALMLRRAAECIVEGGRLVLYSEPLDLESDHAEELAADLIDFALDRAGSRTHDEHVQLFAEAGLATPERRTVGWGYALYEVTITRP